jgi:hypothetical protein
MKNVILNVLKKYSDMQLNLESKAAQQFLANKINEALLTEIRKQKPKECNVADINHESLTDMFHRS